MGGTRAVKYRHEKYLKEQVSSDFSWEGGATVTIKFPEYQTYLYGSCISICSL